MTSEGFAENASAEARAAERAQLRAQAAAERSQRVPSTKGKQAWDKERTRELFERYKREGDESARDELVVAHMNLVRFLAGKFVNRGESMDDLIQVGTVGLIKAIDRFDPERGLEFTTFATPTVLGEIRRHFRDKGWTVRVPRRLQELSAKIGGATDELTSRLQRTPSVAEIAAHLGVTVDEVLEAMESSTAYSSVSLEGSTGSDDDDSPSVIDVLGEEDRELAGTDDRLILRDALASFSPREQQVLKLRFEDGLTQNEIAETLGVSQVQVSRLIRKCLSRMQEMLAG